MSALGRTDRVVLGAVAVATVLAALAHYGHWESVLAFCLATASIAGLAHVVSVGVEQVGERLGPGIAGLLQATLGNLPELFLVIFALRAGEAIVAQNTVIGSIFSNALLVLGIVILVGCRRSGDGVMRFHPRLANDTATLLNVTVFIIVLVGLSLNTHDPAAAHVTTVSMIAAIGLLVVYCVWVVPFVRGDFAAAAEQREAAADAARAVDEGRDGGDAWPHANAVTPPQRDAPKGGTVATAERVEVATAGRGGAADPAATNGAPQAAGHGEARVPLAISIVLLAFGGVGAAFASDWFIDALAPTVDSVGISRGFAGLVIAAIAGNAVENITAVILAAKGQANLAVSVVKSSVGQMAAFMWPALVLVSLGFSHRLTFALHPVYIGALLVTALAMWQITGDGEALPFEGLALIAAYLVLAGITLYE